MNVLKTRTLDISYLPAYLSNFALWVYKEKSLLRAIFPIEPKNILTKWCTLKLL